MHRTQSSLSRVMALLIPALWLCGCTTPSIDTVRQSFYRGQFDPLVRNLDKLQAPDKDRVLFLMERGTVYQQVGEYEKSRRDFISASALIDAFETRSVSKGASSMVINDKMLDYRGMPYERSLLHAMNAMNHLALGNWNDAAVASRRMISRLRPETRGKYPDIAFCRYMAAFGLELSDEPSNAAHQYRQAAKLANGIQIDENTGRFQPLENEAAKAPKGWKNELVVFSLLGRSGTLTGNRYAGPVGPLSLEVYDGATFLGRSHTLTDTRDLAKATDKVITLRKTAKTAARIVIKEAIAEGVEDATDSDGWGDFTRFVLMGLLEQPDARQWSTLPQWWQVIRVPCPEDISNVKLVIKDARGNTLQTKPFTNPVNRHRNMFVTFCREVGF